MKIKQFALRALSGLMTLSLAVVMLTSCGKDNGADKLVDNIPADAAFIVKLNLKQVVENTGCSVDNGKIVLSEKYQHAIREAGGAAAVKIVGNYLEYTEGLGLDAILIYGTNSNGKDVTAVAALTDPEPVKKNLKEATGNPKTENGFEIYNIGGGILAIKDNMIWVADKLSIIERHIDKAKDASISSVAPVTELLTADNAFAFAVNLNDFKPEGINLQQELEREDVPAELARKIADIMNYYACGSMTLSGNSLSGQFYLVDKDGKRNEFGKALNVIDTSFLKNIPADANSVMACGDIADPDIKALINKAVTDAARNNPEGARYSDLLTRLDGTVAAGFEANEVNRLPLADMMAMSENELAMYVIKNLKFDIMAHYPAEVITKITGMLYDEAKQSGCTVNGSSDGLNSISVPDMFNIYFGNSNGYLTVTNIRSDKDATDLTDIFAGKRMMIYGQSDANPTLADMGWNFGSKGQFWLEADALKFNVTLTGTDANFLQAIFEPLTDMDNINKLIELATTLQRMQRNNASYYYYEDEYDNGFSDYVSDEAPYEEAPAEYDY